MKRIIDISEEDYNFLIEHENEYNYERTRIAPILNSTPLKECEVEDCISRKSVYNYILEFGNHEYATDEAEELLDLIASGLKHLPSVYPKSENNT